MPGPAQDDSADRALASEQYFVRALGGFVLGIAGADLVTHEKIPLPRFNFVQVREVAPGRRTAFVERALDHYFQRALRPTFRIPDPVPSHLDTTVRALGFVPRPDRLALLVPGPRPEERSGPYSVRPARTDELDRILPLWTSDSDRPELRTALDIAWHHPNPDERLTPYVALRDDRIASGGLRYEYRGAAGLHFVATAPAERGRGAASALVAGVFGGRRGAGEPPYGFLFADSPRLEARLRALGFEVVRTFTVYELPRSASLALPPVGPEGPPRWRPPRGGGGSTPNRGAEAGAISRPGGRP